MTLRGEEHVGAASRRRSYAILRTAVFAYGFSLIYAKLVGPSTYAMDGIFVDT